MRKVEDGILKDLGVDAPKWAKAFMDDVVGSDLKIDEQEMTVWFANAIMAGFDHGQKMGALIKERLK